MEISIKKVKEIREELQLTHIVIFGISKDGKQHIATHGENMKDAKEAAEAGNRLKKALGWPDNLCQDKPLERICKNCSYWQIDYYYPGERIPDKFHGKCMLLPEPVGRYENDRACKEFDPKL